jgi:dihydrofolate reductase
VTDINTPEIILIAAIGKNRELGYQNQLLWKIPGDLPRFKELTTGHPIIMGRKTFDSIARPLPGRQNIVITRDKKWSYAGVDCAHSPEEAISLAGGGHELFVIGGGEIYSLFIALARKLELTEVDDVPERADVWFPAYRELGFVEASREKHLDKSPPFSYVSYHR